MRAKTLSRTAALLLSASLALPVMISSYSAVYAASAAKELTYTFTGNFSDKAGYAEGQITLKADAAAKYKLYWADDTKALDGYYPIDELSMNAGESKNVSMGYHTAIPAGATKVIAVTDSLYTADAYTVYDIPQSKRLLSASGDLLYKFSTFSDVHIDKGSGWYVNAENNFKQGLAYSVKNNADYIIVSGDCVTNDSGPDKEWAAYQKVLSKSDFVNPVWESDGNHDMRQDVSSGLRSFIKGSGTDGSKSGKPYFYRIDELTGDIFIFMALEFNKSPNQYEEFSDEQIEWATDLIEKNYQYNNIFLIQHSPIEGFGAGDRMSNPYYSGMLNQKHESTKKFKALLEKYPNIVFLSGHTHEDFSMDYNYSDENGTAAHMIHTPSLAGSTMPDSSYTKLERNGGKGFNSQAYMTEVYENEIVFYGVNILKELIYPKYCYIMEGSRTHLSPRIGPIVGPLPPKNIDVDIRPELEKAAGILSDNYQLASYDSYQALKKLYYKYKNAVIVDERILDEFESCIEGLEAYTGNIQVFPLRDAYYFVNNKGWSKVCAYAWDGSSKNKEWPGAEMTKVGKDAENNDIYMIDFSQTKYSNIIFNCGSNEKQTVDLSLRSFKYDTFSIAGSENGKYCVSNFSLEEMENTHYALLYYVTDEHGWNAVDTFMKPDGNGAYTTTYTSGSSNNFSFCVYDKFDDKYYSLSESAKLTFEAGSEHSFTLAKSSSRGKSITVSGLNASSLIDLAYDPSAKTVKVTCRSAFVPKELENTSSMSAESIILGGSVNITGSADGGTAPCQFAFVTMNPQGKWFVLQNYSDSASYKFTPACTGTYKIQVKAKDSAGTVKVKAFDLKVLPALANTSSVSAASVIKGQSVTFSGSASGGKAPYQYAYVVKAPSGKWTVLRGYSSAESHTWTPASLGTYTLQIKVKDSTGTVRVKEFALKVNA